MCLRIFRISRDIFYQELEVHFLTNYPNNLKMRIILIIQLNKKIGIYIMGMKKIL